MKPDEYLRKLSEVAEWEVPKIDEINRPKHLPVAQRPRSRWASEEERLEYIDEVTPDFVVGGRNLTMMPRIKRIKQEPKPCELGCGEMVLAQKIDKTHHQWPEPHWRTKCTNCQHYVHPSGEGLVKGVNVFHTHFAKKKTKKS